MDPILAGGVALFVFAVLVLLAVAFNQPALRVLDKVVMSFRGRESFTRKERLFLVALASLLAMVATVGIVKQVQDMWNLPGAAASGGAILVGFAVLTVFAYSLVTPPLRLLVSMERTECDRLADILSECTGCQILDRSGARLRAARKPPEAVSAPEAEGKKPERTEGPAPAPEERRPDTIQIVDEPQLRAIDLLAEGSRRSCFDVALIDITFRGELLKRALIQDLSRTRYRGMVPAGYMGALRQLARKEDARYCIPIRPNVRFLLLKKSILEELRKAAAQQGKDLPADLKTWQDLKAIAQAAHDIFGRPMVALMAGGPESHEGLGIDAALLLLELIYAARGDPADLTSPQSLEAMQLLRELWPSVEGVSREHTFDAADDKLEDGPNSVLVAQAWAYTLRRLHHLDMLQRVETYPGLGWGDNTQPVTLMGGSAAVVPSRARRIDVSRWMIRTLLSEDTQSAFVCRMGWPPAFRVKLTGRGESEESIAFGEQCQDTLIDAFQHARAAPDFWTKEVSDIFLHLFKKIIDPQADIEQAAREAQARVEGAALKVAA